MKPEQVIRVGSVQASIFNNQRETEDGQVRGGYSVNLHRRYQDKQNKWQSTSAFRLSELPQAELALRLATAYVAEREAIQSSDKEVPETNGSEEFPPQTA
jgi:hypothetical protein